MKKISILASLMFGSLVLGSAIASNAAAVEGMGWDGTSQELVGRLGLGGFNHLEVGVGLRYNGGAPNNTDAEKDAATTISASVRYLLALHSWEKFTGYLHVGGYFRDDANNPGTIFLATNGNPNKAALAFVVGYQPELVILNHLAVSTLFGVSVPVMPDVQIGFVGQNVSIVEGLNFRILF